MKTEIRYRKGYSPADCTITVGQVLRGQQGARIVIQADEPIDTDQGQKPWSQRYETRPCTAAEAATAEREWRIAELKQQQRALSGPPDDERDHDRIAGERAAITAELAALQKEN